MAGADNKSGCSWNAIVRAGIDNFYWVGVDDGSRFASTAKWILVGSVCLSKKLIITSGVIILCFIGRTARCS